ncbi:MAG: SpoIIE family protein phosphatase [Leptospira sp.]|nr:SpoIIE family protein phosphatase [Leptospira sp.]
MSIRYKIFMILAISQILLLATLTLTFAILITSVKNEPQNQRAIELSRNFQRELHHKDEKLRLLISEMINNPDTYRILKNGLAQRSEFSVNQAKLNKIMERYDLSIFEIGDRMGKVVYRVHRPNDFSDDKSSQPLIQAALKGKTNSSLETGHSGLGFRVTAPISNIGTLLIGQVVDSEFAESISGKESVQISIFEKDKHLISSSKIMGEFLSKSENRNLESHSRITYNGIPYYYVRLPFEDKGMSSLDLNFHILIDEKELNLVSKKIWYSFILVATLIFIAIFMISYLFSRDIINAVKSLNNAMKNIDLSITDDIQFNRKDEIGQMGTVFNDMKKELYKHQNHLEEMVQNKTIELQEALRDLKKVKEQQDGDYFLTSLLIKPLTGGKIYSKNIEVKTLERQKKVFTFRNRKSEIGGDLSVINEIILKGKKYTVFLNADAMGKSIQGAGGVLVMGTVFKSVITRTQQIPMMQDRHPERWLKDTFLELQDVFISFDGSMLLSAVIGLIDDDTGTMYYVNAEHPWVVLYRDKKANFIENELLLRKIGFEITEFSRNDLSIKVFQLNPDDVILIGSDGRDDIMYGQNEHGERIINEDETEFLKRVEEGDGNLEKIEEYLLKQGELTDDLSLIRIGYKEGSIRKIENDFNSNIDTNNYIKDGIKDFKAGQIENSIVAFEKALELSPRHPVSMRELSKLYIKTKDFEKAIELSEVYIGLKPNDTDFLYYIAYAYKQKKNYELGIDYSERLRLRDNKNLKNLILLSELYMHIGNFTRSDEILKHILEIEPENPKAKRLLGFLEEKMGSLV